VDRSVKRLEVGIIDNNGKKLDLLKEMLNHQGIIFKEINKLNDNSKKFPCVILIENNQKDIKKAGKYCLSTENILIMSEILPMDVIFSAFSGNLDKLYLENKLMDPQITELELNLINKIRECFFKLDLPFIRKWYWPNFAKACCVITHDIDSLNHPPPLRKKFDFLKYMIIQLFNKKAYRSNIKEIIKKEKENGIKSSFYFLNDYGKYQKDFLNYINLLNNKFDFEIGLHAPFHTHHDPLLLKKYKNFLSKKSKRKVVGIRQHGLNFSVPHTWKYYDQIGFEYDATFSYNNKFGFRAGLCYPYHPFNALNNKRFNVLELPTSFMDWTGLYNNLNYNDLLNTLLKLGKTVEKYNGCFVLIFHNMYINKDTYPKISKLFSTTLDYIKKKNYWVATAAECSRWWRNREEAKVQIEFNDKIISGVSSISLPICIEQFDKKAKYYHIENTFKINLNDGN